MDSRLEPKRITAPHCAGGTLRFWFHWQRVSEESKNPDLPSLVGCGLPTQPLHNLPAPHHYATTMPF